MKHALLLAVVLMMSGVLSLMDSASGQVNASAAPASVLVLGAQEPKPDTILATREIVEHSVSHFPTKIYTLHFLPIPMNFGFNMQLSCIFLVY